MAAVQFKDYYKTLGVARGADEKAVRAAYRTLARRHHPDINPGDKGAEERFKEINEAYEVLSDPGKRKMYDRYGEEWQRYRDAGFTGDEPAGRAGPRQTVDPADFGEWFARQRTRETAGSSTTTNGSFSYETYRTYEFGDEPGGSGGFSDFFRTLFGEGRSARTAQEPRRAARPRPRRGEDLEAEVTVGLEEAFRGATRAFNVQTDGVCPTCDGTGLVREAPCPTCDATGRVPRSRQLEVRIPPGVATGSRIRVSGQGGAAAPGGQPGDVFLRVTVAPDPRFERDGDDLRAEVEIPLWTALLGGEALVPTPTGKVALTVPAGSQPGRTFRLRGQGMPRLKAEGRGDLFARLKVGLPTDLSERERELVEELRRLRPAPAPA